MTEPGQGGMNDGHGCGTNLTKEWPYKKKKERAELPSAFMAIIEQNGRDIGKLLPNLCNSTH